MASKESSRWCGKIVRMVRFLKPQELAREVWPVDQDVAALEFTDGTLVYAACDPEGNGPGALFGVLPDGQTLWVRPASGAGRDRGHGSSQ
jgi:hypothetical protein